MRFRISRKPRVHLFAYQRGLGPARPIEIGELRFVLQWGRGIAAGNVVKDAHATNW